MSFLKPTTNDTQRMLGVYIYYRLSLGLLLGIMHWTGLSKDIFGYSQPELFTNIALFYIVICLLSLFLYWANTLKAYSTHLLLLLVVDFVALVTMIFASGNLSGGLGYLLLIPMAIGSTFLRGQANIGLAAFATLLVLAMSLLSAHYGLSDNRDFFSAGVTGFSLFVTAIAFRIFSEKIQASQYAAQKQTEQANYLQLISQRIVETMRTGIVVVDRELRIQLINHAAATLLTIDDKFEGLVSIKAIHTRLMEWKNDGVIPSSFSFPLASNQTLKVSFAALNDARFPSIMLFVEDMQRLSQEAQQLKLASLGRLAASIAHEIRNPLGAISHASQLMSESQTINKEDHKLLTIIQNHSKRINFIINNILDFSRRKHANPEIINLNHWIADFKEEYQQYHHGTITISSQQPDTHAKVDPHHLYQIINNLADNGMRYSQMATGQAKIQFALGIQKKDQRPFIEVIDFGKGIEADKLHQIFEPFYTTETTGSGLGLYLCKELGEANQANLSYSYGEQKKSSVFRLTLSHPQRSIELQ